jgi:hypothetical protein
MKPSSLVMPIASVAAVFLLIGAAASCSSAGSSSDHPGDGSEPDGGSHAEGGHPYDDAGGSPETGVSPPDSGPRESGIDGESSFDGGSCVVAKVGPSPECTLPPLIGSAPPTISTTCTSGEPPQAAGGDIANGLYFLQSWLSYGSCAASPVPIQVSIYICGGLWLVEDNYVNDAGASTGLLAYDYVVTRDGASLVQTEECTSASSSSPPIDLTFTSSEGQLTLLQTVDGGALEARYAKQSMP